ncbi:MAG: cation:proton antiporter [Chitinophagales bacterium]|nr:cation:proton antiporter [Chitinophagales bacterium]
MVAKLSSDQLLSFLVILSILLIASRLLGEIFKKFKLPAVMGELFAGIILGPSLMGAYFPGTFNAIFVDPKQSYSAFDGLAQVGIIFLLFVAGMEVNLNTLKRRGKAAAKISFASSFFPFVTGFIATWFFYDQLFSTPTDNKLIPAMFIGTALCITALSVSAKILIDLDLIKTRFGNMILTAAMVNDFLGWMLFSIVLNLINTQHKGFGVIETVFIVLFFAAFLMTGGRWLIDQTFLAAKKYFPSAGTNITVAIIFCILCSLFTEWAGIHAVFGAFLAGVAVGASKNFTDKSRDVLHQFITNIFAPLFFASIGLRVNFITNFDWKICLFILSIASIGKILGGTLGARLSGFKINKALAVGFGMNARGSMEIVLGLLALQAKIIDEKVFVGLVVMTIVTVMVAGPMITFFLRRHDAVIGYEAQLKHQNRIPATG